MNLSLDTPSRETIAQQLPSFTLGRHLLANRSLDGYWTRYCVVEHPKDRHRKNLHPLESFLLNEAPSFLATQERFGIFQSQLQQRLRDGMTIASVPSGYMDDLLGLDYKNTCEVKIVGCDIDQKSCDGARENAERYGVTQALQTHCMDAWEVGKKFPEAFDMLTSNGLNIYVDNPAKEIELYRSFAGALKSGGYLVTSFLTPPPALAADSPWQGVDPVALQKQKLIFSDVLGVKWQNYNSPETMKEKLSQAGFHNIEIHYDRQQIFPTIVAQKM
jgi:hypothetical protein